MDSTPTTFQQQRPRLYGIAYRMLGSKADSEDVLQDAYLRWHETDAARVRSPEAWLTTTVAHLCIDRLRSARAKRETYIGPWLPEPLIGDAMPFPEHHAERSDDVSMAFLLMLERLAPKERAAFLLHDVFDCGYAEISQILDKSQEAVRQTVHRARQRVRRERRRFSVSERAHRRLLERFITAIQSADRNTLFELFAPEATWTSDGGGKVAAARKVLHGNIPIAKLLAGVGRNIARNSMNFTYQLVPINGQTGILGCLDGQPNWAMSLVTDGMHIFAGFAVLNPDKLARVPISTLH